MSYLKRLMRKRGSALLIVLGFLAFLMVSGVSFSIMMRVERTATSNYKHSVAARHLLEAGLFRAMDEIDSELRLKREKFPETGWTGRVKVSPLDAEMPMTVDFIRANMQGIARPLSLEALSFIPPILVNDVRYYSILASTNGMSESNYGPVKAGAKWRRLSMPIENRVDIQSGEGVNSYGRSVVGRYAYVCVNLSDMLNVNGMSATARSISNRVSLAHLLMPGKEEPFEARRKIDGGYYATLQDFYAALDNSPVDKLFSAPQGGKGNSPYFDFVKRGFNNNIFNYDPAGGGSRGNPTNHVLVTDGFAKSLAELIPNPDDADAVCNIAVNPPFTAAQIIAMQQDPAMQPPILGAEFKKALMRCFSDNAERNEIDTGIAFKAMLADYLLPDELAPKRLDVPTCKRVPMISGIKLMPIFTPKIVQMPPPAPDAPITYKLQLIGGLDTASGESVQEALSTLSTMGGLNVMLCWPFKNHQLQANLFKLDVDGWINIVDGAKNASDGDLNVARVAFTGSGDIRGCNPNPLDQNSCYISEMVKVSFNNVPLDALSIPWATQANPTAPLVGLGGYMDPLVIEVMVRVRVVDANGVIFDSVPHVGNYPPGSHSIDEERVMTKPKIYFQTLRAFNVDAAAGRADTPLPFEWTALEVPDPRFNHNAANWYNASGDWPGTAPRMSQYTGSILGIGGRDNGIFMAASGTGEMQSPGELGFIVRPRAFEQSSGLPDAGDFDFLGQLSVAGDNRRNDREFFFRTVRLYDHGGRNDHERADLVFKYFEHFDDNAPGNSRVRVNPLSDLPAVLLGAIDRVPYDYAFAWRNADPAEDAAAKNRDHFQDYSGANPSPFDQAGWAQFSAGWVEHVMDAVDRGQVNDLGGERRRIADVYGHRDFSDRKWYSEDPRVIFFGHEGGNIVLSSPLYDVDRKMLYSFSMDAFSDRQQLFLYVVQAEATTPGIGGDARSLAGGRAVAVVWRDPYPKPYPAALNNASPPNLYEDGVLKKRSPWGWEKEQYGDNIRYDMNISRRGGYHDQRILYFKQLDQ